MKNGWPNLPLGEALRQRQCDVAVNAADSYQFAGVYSFGRGVFRGQKKLGNQFVYRRLTRLRSGDFVYPKLMAWEGAFGTVPARCDGCVVSTEFPVFELNPERISPDFLSFYFQIPRVWQEISGGSTGTNVRRRRLHPDDFLRALIPLPPLTEQRRVVARIEELAAQLSEARTLRRQADDEADALLRSILTHDEESTPTRMRELVKLRSPDVTVRPDETYQFAGVYCFGRGVFKAGRKSGMDFAYSHLTRLRAGEFVYPKLMAWEGALGVVPPDCDSCVVSTEFPVFEVDEDRVLPEVLDTHFRTPSVWPKLAGQSTGTNVRRRRLNPQDFLDYEMPLPSRKTQVTLRKVKAEVDELQRLQAETSAELSALLPSILDRAFSGGLI
jgi:type I restriction enzyme S subunit